MRLILSLATWHITKIFKTSTCSKYLNLYKQKMAWVIEFFCWMCRVIRSNCIWPWILYTRLSVLIVTHRYKINETFQSTTQNDLFASYLYFSNYLYFANYCCNSVFFQCYKCMLVICYSGKYLAVHVVRRMCRVNC